MAEDAETAAAAAARDAQGFDQRLEALERIVRELEDGGLGLEAAIGRYQEGVALLKSCHATLEATRRRVLELTAAPDGSDALASFDGDPDFDAPAR